MSKRAIVRRQGVLIEISVDGQVPLSKAVVKKLAEPLEYTHRQYLKGQAAYDESGSHEAHVKLEHRRLYHFDGEGRFCCLRGFLSRLTEILHGLGYAVDLIDKNPPVSPEIYRANWDRVFELFTFRPQQDVCLAQIDMHDGGVIDAVPAFGKTHMMGMICALYPKAKIDIITEGKDNVNSLITKLMQWIPGVGQMGCGKKRHGRVTVYSADSLHHSDYTANIVLADEVHTLMTDQRVEKLARYPCARMFGFTATTDTRFDNAHVRMEGLCGPVIFRMLYSEAVSHDLVVPISVQWFGCTMDCNPCSTLRDDTARKRHGIWRNSTRNKIIADTAMEMFNEGHQVLVLVETVEHGLHLHQLLPDFQLCYSEAALSDAEKRQKFINWGILDPTTPALSAAGRDTMRRAFERREFLGAIATGVWSTGVSFDSLEVLWRADGGASATASVQSPGRVCRIEESIGKRVGLVFDSIDYFDDNFRRKSQERRYAYAKQEWTQIMPDGSIWVPGTRGTYRASL